MENRIVNDVCQIFEDVTGRQADCEREKGVILFWEKRGLQNRDFRLLIEHEFADPRQKEFYSQPGNLVLRFMLNPSRADRLSDVLTELRYAERAREKKEVLAKMPSRTPRMLLRCGAKVFREEYEAHNEACFAAKGRCFYP